MSLFRILHTESSYGLGGQEYRVLSEAKAMGLRSHHVVLAAPETSQLVRLARQEGICYETIQVGITGWGYLLPRFLKIIQKHQIQIVHTHGSQDSWMAAIAGRLSSRQPIIVRTRHKSIPVSDSLRHALLYRMLPHAVATTGEVVRRQFIAQNHLNAKMVYSIPTGVDVQRFQASSEDVSLKRALGIGLSQPVVGTVSFLRPEKGMDVLIESIGLVKKVFPQVCCLIVGTGQERQQLLEKISERQLENAVILAGFREDIPEVLGIMNVFVLPSLEEGLPQSLLQALAMERPVVASAVGGVPEVIRHQHTGLLVPPGDPVALAHQVEWLLSRPNHGKTMGKAGRNLIVQSHSVESMLTKTEELYATLWEQQKTVAA